MYRKTIKPLLASRIDGSSTPVLPPGVVLTGCRILRNHAPGAEPYVVEFQSAGERYSCPLFLFQPRTQSLAPPLDPVLLQGAGI